MSLLQSFLDSVVKNLFQPLLLFFYAGFLIPILHVQVEIPKALYQGLTIYLLLSIGWKGGEELAELNSEVLIQALGFMIVGFITNFVIGIITYNALRLVTKLRQIDCATVAGYYGSDSAGTFVTCSGVLAAANIEAAPYMPVMLAVMEIPGCLVALYLVSKMRETGMDAAGNMPHEAGYDRFRKDLTKADELEAELTLQPVDLETHGPRRKDGGISLSTLHEVFLNPGIYLLFAGIAIGYISRRQGERVTMKDDALFINLFHGFLCVFLLEMGMTAAKKMRDLKVAGWQFVAFALIGPNVFATCGILIAHTYSIILRQPFDLGTYVLFAVLCGASSYIAVPAVQRMAIPEASPTLPIAASLGVTFSYNVTIGIPVYLLIAKTVITTWPVVSKIAEQTTG